MSGGNKTEYGGGRIQGWYLGCLGTTLGSRKIIDLMKDLARQLSRHLPQAEKLLSTIKLLQNVTKTLVCTVKAEILLLSHSRRLCGHDFLERGGIKHFKHHPIGDPGSATGMVVTSDQHGQLMSLHESQQQ